ncbi:MULTISPECIES: hypothetical protein [Alkalimonas]|uniref:Bacteriocin n=1 Tax=Alkalimonas mucilaginosa TaxID=3057676 RepID=A0ABU7JFK7_9GAMM|nr:hypothetical protein [Alkalimonas sp. MEB004]MEE2023935.1 hypothetical protein [Alkalimonas sp. MEB004]
MKQNSKMKVLGLQELKQVQGGRTAGDLAPAAWSTWSNNCGGVKSNEWSMGSNGCRDKVIAPN